jgi:site-specific DNA-cytosine methylase
MGLERAGWRTVSFSEIDPYASAVLAERWPGVPNLGDVVRLDGRDSDDGQPASDAQSRKWRRATLWTGGFPCQDLSVAGKRRGMGAGTRSGLAYAFLDLVGRHHPRFVLLENVPGLLSSHGGRDMAALIGALVELGYGVGYRILDARYFGVPQRRRRVFILGDALGGRAGAERAAEVLSVGSRCRWHPPTGVEAGPGAAAGAPRGVDVVGTLNFGAHIGIQPDGQSAYSGQLIPVGSSPDPGRMRAADGLAGRSHDRDGLAAFVKHSRYGENGDPRRPAGSSSETWGTGDLSHSLDAIGHAARTATAILGAGGMTTDPLLPLGLDSHRYRCCGNGVVADVSYWIGLRLAEIA